MAKKLYLIILSLTLISCAQIKYTRQALPRIDSFAGLKAQIDSILTDSLLNQAQVGIKIVSLNSGETVYEKDSEKLFTPASNMKLLTTATALKVLGQGFKFRTILAADTAAVSDSVIHGNLYLKGYGNPDLSLDDLHRMAHELKHAGISHITGNLICDDTYFDDLYWGEGWMWDDASGWDYARISALNVNDNCVTLWVKPGKVIGDSLFYQLEPATAFVKIINKGLTVDALDTVQLKAYKVERQWQPVHENKLTIAGGLSPASTVRTHVIDVIEPALYTGALFSEILKTENIRLDGLVQKGVLPDTNFILVEHLSAPLTETVININKISDNLSAEALLKTLAAEKYKQPGNARQGLSLVKNYLNEIGIDTTKLRLADGSGLSRYNAISPDQVTRLLTAIHHDFKIQAEFKTSLPIAGVDGLLHNRMKNTPAEGKLRGKTGTMTGVANLSGYTTTADGEIIAFSIMMEGFVCSARQIKNIQDRIGAAISGI